MPERRNLQSKPKDTDREERMDRRAWLKRVFAAPVAALGAGVLLTLSEGEASAYKRPGGGQAPVQGQGRRQGPRPGNRQGPNGQGQGGYGQGPYGQGPYGQGQGPYGQGQGPYGGGYGQGPFGGGMGGRRGPGGGGWGGGMGGRRGPSGGIGQGGRRR